jgi:hypothetical protein
VEAANRFAYEKVHGEGTTFPYRAAPPDDLLNPCRTDKIWMPGAGADVAKVLVLAKIRETGGVPAATTSAPTPVAQLLLRSWREHNSWDWDDDSAAVGGGFSPVRVADLLYVELEFRLIGSLS